MTIGDTAIQFQQLSPECESLSGLKYIYRRITIYGCPCLGTLSIDISYIYLISIYTTCVYLTVCVTYIVLC